MIHLLTAVVALGATLLYSERTGKLWAIMPVVERVARGGLVLVLSTLVVGFAERARMGSDFLWIHWLILGALAFTLAGHVGLLIAERRELNTLAPQE